MGQAANVYEEENADAFLEVAIDILSDEAILNASENVFAVVEEIVWEEKDDGVGCRILDEMRWVAE